MTRDELAILLEGEALNAYAEDVRCGIDPKVVAANALSRAPRYDDAISQNARATFQAIADGEKVTDG